MSWFRRERGSGADEASDGTDVPGGEAGASEEASEEAARREAEEAEQRAEEARRAALDAAEAQRAQRGPFDESEVDDAVTRVDLGALRIPAREGMELRLEIEDKTQRVIAATISLAGSSVQMQVFAAPRRDGVWDDIRAEIAAQVTKQGGAADEIAGTFGRELLARVPARTPDGRTAHRLVRFTGVDGPRWFLRAVFNGRAAAEEAAAADLEQVVRGTVVVRGAEARPPRELLPLKLPPQAAQAAEAARAAAAAKVEAGGDAVAGEPGHAPHPEQPGEPSGTPSPELDPRRRGPEITEIG